MKGLDTALVILWAFIGSLVVVFLVMRSVYYLELYTWLVLCVFCVATTLRILAARGRSPLNWVGSTLACLLIEMGAIQLGYLPPLSRTMSALSVFFSGMLVAVGEAMLPQFALWKLWTYIQPRPRTVVRRKLPTQ